MENENTPAIPAEAVRFIGTPEALGELFAALAAAQAEFAPIAKDSTAKVQMKAGGQYTFDYAGLDVIIAATAPALTKHGLAMMQFPSSDELVTVLAKGGARIESRCALTNWSDAQAFGSAITYFKRYARISILSVFPANEDDDAAVAMGHRADISKRNPSVPASKPASSVKPDPGALSPQTKARIGELGRALSYGKTALEEFSTAQGTGALDDLTEVKGLALVKALEAKQATP